MDQPQQQAPLPATAAAQPQMIAGRDLLKSTIGQNPGTAAFAIAVLVVLILILAYALVHYKGMCPKEGFHQGGSRAAAARAPMPASACGPGETPVSYQNPDGSMMTYCRSTDALPGPATVCGAGWDPAATAEAEALATVGSFQHDSYGERRLQRAINAAYDSNVGLSDEQLATLMHQGGTP